MKDRKWSFCGAWRLAGVCFGLIALAGVGLDAQEADLGLKASRSEDGAVLLEWEEASPGDRYIVEVRERVDSGAWAPLEPASQWPISDTVFIDNSLEGVGARFYRIVSVPAVQATRGAIISSELLDSFSKFELQLLITLAGISGVSVENGVEVYKVIYETIDVFGQPTVASGAIAVPEGSGVYPMISYQHGTVFDSEEVPSRLDLDNIESFATVALAASGLYAVAPDYLGQGDSPGFHPYIVAEPSATVTLDMIRAGMNFAAEQEVGLTGELGLVGYSEGGYVTMATHRALESEPLSGMALAGSAPMAGPYDLSGTMLDLALSTEPHPDTGLIAFVMLSYNRIYQVVEDASELFAPEFGAGLVDWFENGAALPSDLPAAPRDLLNPDLALALEGDLDHPIRIALRENDLVDWTPQAPMLLMHCAGDTTVPVENSMIASESFISRGATGIEFVDAAPEEDHTGCILPSVLVAEDWFDALFSLEE